jgi:hypothetical protein
MTQTTINAVGFCAHYSTQGDWAFEFALDLARRGEHRLNVFHFLADPYDPSDHTGELLSPSAKATLAVAQERELRLYYDERGGDYLDIGFRLCEDPEWTELHRCLTRREFQVLVLAYPEPGATFAGKPLEEFAHSFVCPVVLVGPGSPGEIRLNRPARLLGDSLGIGPRDFELVCAAV